MRVNWIGKKNSNGFFSKCTYKQELVGRRKKNEDTGEGMKESTQRQKIVKIKVKDKGRERRRLKRLQERKKNWLKTERSRKDWSLKETEKTGA
jgi:hypothetical protein